MEVEFTVLGVTAMTAALQHLVATVPEAVGNALRAEAEIEMTEAKRRTPVWNPARKVPPGHVPGTLRASGIVTGPTVDGADISVRLAFGGPAAPYALYVHEDMEAFHASGQAKFLESTLLESAPYLAARVAARLAQTLTG